MNPSQEELNATAPALAAARGDVETDIKAKAAPTQKLSASLRWALLAAFHGDDTDWVHGNTINSLLKRGLIQWVDNRNAYANGRGGYITTPAGRELAESLEGSA